MTGKPELILSPWIKGETFHYECSRCKQAFLPPEDRSPKEAMEEVLEAFEEHIREDHSGEAAQGAMPLPEFGQIQ
jgi:hypothetical protein